MRVCRSGYCVALGLSCVTPIHMCSTATSVCLLPRSSVHTGTECCCHPIYESENKTTTKRRVCDNASRGIEHNMCSFRARSPSRQPKVIFLSSFCFRFLHNKFPFQSPAADAFFLSFTFVCTSIRIQDFRPLSFFSHWKNGWAKNKKDKKILVSPNVLSHRHSALHDVDFAEDRHPVMSFATT